jgi:hypothetical protein
MVSGSATVQEEARVYILTRWTETYYNAPVKIMKCELACMCIGLFVLQLQGTQPGARQQQIPA